MTRLNLSLALAAFLAGTAWLAGFSGDFPQNDDWAFALSVRELLETGRVWIPDLTVATLVLHTLWGGLFSKIFGFSFGVLRGSTLVMGLAGSLAFASCLSRLGFGVRAAWLGAFALACNPLELALGLSFMTDVPYLAWCLVSTACVLKGLQSRGGAPDLRLFLLAGLAASAAYLVRQPGVLLTPAAWVALTWERRRLPSVRESVALLALPALAVLAHQAWFRQVHGPTWASVKYLGAGPWKQLFDPAWILALPSRLPAILIYMGLFVLPLAAGRALAPKGGRPTASGGRLSVESPGMPGTTLLGIGWLAVGAFILIRGALPYFENTLHRAGLGTLTVHHAAAKSSGVWGSAPVWAVLTLASWLALLTLAGGPRPAEDKRLSWRAFALAWAFQAGAFLLGAEFYDRYLLVLLPLALALALGPWAETPRGLAGASAGLAVCALVSVAGLADFMAWNRAKWGLGRRVAASLDAPERVANGLDWDGWHGYRRSMDELKRVLPLRSIGEWDWQARLPRRVLVSFSKDPPSSFPGARLVDSERYRSLLASEGTLYAWDLFPGP